MEGVSYRVSYDLNIRHLTHNIPQYNIFDASYRLFQAISYWPEGTTFVSVVDPGVGSDRKSVVAKTKNGMYIITPDNGTLTHIAKRIGLEEVRLIDEGRNRLKDSEQSYTFYGRDVYAYTGARLASGQISFEEVGPKMDVDDIVMLELYGCKKIEGGIFGYIDIWMCVSVRFGLPFLMKISRTAASRSAMTFWWRSSIMIVRFTPVASITASPLRMWRSTFRSSI